jgi:hypothetical protein
MILPKASSVLLTTGLTDWTGQALTTTSVQPGIVRSRHRPFPNGSLQIHTG